MHQRSPLVLHDEAVCLQYAVYDGDIRARYLVYDDVAGLVPLTWGVRQKEQISAVERRLHRTTVCAPFARQVGEVHV